MHMYCMLILRVQVQFCAFQVWGTYRHAIDPTFHVKRHVIFFFGKKRHVICSSKFENQD